MNVDEIPPILLFLQIKVHHHENILGFFFQYLCHVFQVAIGTSEVAIASGNAAGKLLWRWGE